MMKFEKYYEELKQLDVGKVLKDEPLYKHTTYRVGGPAKLFIKVQNVGELIEVIKYCRKHRIQLFVIGRGSNLLFSDKSFEGIIISLEDMNQYHVNGSEVTAQCGVTMIKLAYDCAKIGLSGFEFMGGIPGNIGGGIFMNAGAYKSCLSKVVKSVKVLDEHLKVVELSKDEMDFSYRHSIIQDHPKWIVLEATFVLENKSVEEINETLDNRMPRHYIKIKEKKEECLRNLGINQVQEVFLEIQKVRLHGNILMMQVLEVMKLVEHKFLQNILTLL